MCSSLIELFQLIFLNLDKILLECHSLKTGKLLIIWFKILLYIFSEIPSVNEYLLWVCLIKEESSETYFGFVIWYLFLKWPILPLTVISFPNGSIFFMYPS